MAVTKKATFSRLPVKERTLGDNEYKLKSLQNLTTITVGGKRRVIKVGDTLSQRELDDFCKDGKVTVVVQ